jgi:hypothetical protein
MSSQTELRPLQLAESTAASGISGPLTDMQLAEASSGWTMRPNRSEPSSFHPVLGNHLYVTALDNHDSHPNLMSPRDANNILLRRVQRLHTRPYFRVCIACPITALIFGLGGLDWRMRQISGGRINAMSPTAKREALRVFAPLGLIFYTVIALMIALLVVAENRHGG